MSLEGKAMPLSRETKTDLIILAADILKDARADREIRDAVGTAGPSKAHSRKNPDENVFLAGLLADTIVFVELDHQGILRVAPRPK
jgi:hypothetical protein